MLSSFLGPTASFHSTLIRTFLQPRTSPDHTRPPRDLHVGRPRVRYVSAFRRSSVLNASYHVSRGLFDAADHLGWISRNLCEVLAAAQSTTVAIEPTVYVTGPTCDVPQIQGTQYAGSDGSGSDSGEAADKALPLYSSLKIVHGRPSIRRILQDGVAGSSGPVSVDGERPLSERLLNGGALRADCCASFLVSGPSSLTASVSSALASNLTSPASVLKGTPSVTLNVETFGMSR